MRRAIVIVVCALAAPAVAEPRPTLDEFYERTRDRNAGFDACIGYCDGTYLATLLVGGETANPSTDAARPLPATGARLGIELGARDHDVSVVRTRLWADVLRVNANGKWLADLAWRLTAFKRLGRPGDDEGWHLSLDNVVAQHSELRPSDVAQLQQVPYRSVDTEAEVARIGPEVDKDGHFTVALGVANRVRWPIDGSGLDRRTAVAGAVAVRGFAKELRDHAQLDIVRIKYTSWDVPGGRASATTISAGYQRLPVGLDTLPLWALVGYEWAGDREGVVAQIGMDLPLATAHGEIEIAPMFERHLDVDPLTATAVRVTAARLVLRHTIGVVRWGVDYEAAVVEDQQRVHAITPELGLAYRGFELGLAYRFTFARRDPAMPTTSTLPRDRFEVALDRRF